MIIKKIKQNILVNKYNKLLAEAVKNKQISAKIINSVAILTTEDISDTFDLQKQIERQLNLRNPKIYSFRDNEKYKKPSFKHFSEKAFNWKGNIIDKSLESFLEQPFDLLINYYNQKNQYLEYVTLQSKAAFKVGFSGINKQLFDMEIIEKIENPEVFMSELARYLRVLKKLT
ncbi:hypothetical protein [Tenacibaculum sp. UWU-22]|uniref:DUF6913 domain-containing protein n=1 Tax=Tenacibaculum sp. UWU-22 TaxID=3234187 RepID=UPI0034DB600A